MKTKYILKVTKDCLEITGANDVELLDTAKRILMFIAEKHNLEFRSETQGKNLCLKLIKEEKQ